MKSAGAGADAVLEAAQHGGAREAAILGGMTGTGLGILTAPSVLGYGLGSGIGDTFGTDESVGSGALRGAHAGAAMLPGMIGGGALGGAAGGALGHMISPGVGTHVGALAGSLLGAGGGSYLSHEALGPENSPLVPREDA